MASSAGAATANQPAYHNPGYREAHVPTAEAATTEESAFALAHASQQVLRMILDARQSYELALTIASHHRLDALLSDVLPRFARLVGFPCLMLLEQTTQPASLSQGSEQLTLSAALGDERLGEHIGENLIFPKLLVDGECALFSYGRFGHLPLQRDHYRSVLRLPLHGYGVLMLLSPELPDQDAYDLSTLSPLLRALANTILLCQQSTKPAPCGLQPPAVESNNQRLRRVLDSSNDALLLVAANDLSILDANHHAAAALGYSDSQLLELRLDQLLPLELREDLINLLQETPLESEGLLYSTEQLHRNGSLLPVEMRIDLAAQGDQPPLLCILIREEEPRSEGQDELFEEQERALVTLESIGDGVITTDRNGLISYMNPIAEQLTGYQLDLVRGKPHEQVMIRLHENSRETIPSPVSQCLREQRIVGISSHTILVNRYGREVAIEDSAAPIRSRDGELIGVVLVFHDVSKARSMAHELSWQATHDAMTGLLNRSEFESRLDEVLGHALADNSLHAMLYLDLDQFKIVNDTSGHVAGDELLKQLGILLQHQVRVSDTLARLGGDEFGVLLTDCALDQAIRIAEEIRNAVSRFRFSWEDGLFEVGVSIGIVEINSLYSEGSQVMSNADIACYAAKDLGRNRLHIYHPDDDELRRRHSEMLWVSRINSALSLNHLELFCQPIVPANNASGVTDHYEVLVRLREEDGRLIPPNAFIPAAERYKIMPEVDRWIISRVFTHLHHYQKQNPDAAPIQLSINLSGATINTEDTQKFIASELERHQLNPAHICFEITETAAISNLTSAHRLFTDLKQLGLSFALDDFGNGVSSFAYLKHLPIDYLKLDGSYVREMLKDPIDDAMVAAINQIGHVMGLKTIAEYVESEALRQRLVELKVDYVQGYAVGKPRPLSEVLGPLP